MNMRHLIVILAALVANMGLPAGTTVGQEADGGWQVYQPSIKYSAVGTAFEELSLPITGIISVVAQGDLTAGNEVPIIVRNNTDGPLTNVTALVDVLSHNGKYVTGSATTNVVPPTLEPGALGLVSVRIQAGIPIPEDASFIAYVEGTGGRPANPEWLGVHLESYAPKDGGADGTISNSSRSRLDELQLRLACFDDDGELRAVVAETFNYTMLPKMTVNFEVSGQEVDCSEFIFVGTGHLEEKTLE